MNQTGHNADNGRLPPLDINEYNPVPDGDALNIVGLVKKSGKISGYCLSDGTQVSKSQGVEMAKQNKIKGVAVAVNQGTEYLRALPDSAQNNNLGNLPSVSEQ